MRCITLDNKIKNVRTGEKKAYNKKRTEELEEQVYIAEE